MTSYNIKTHSNTGPSMHSVEKTHCYHHMANIKTPVQII